MASLKRGRRAPAGTGNAPSKIEQLAGRLNPQNSESLSPPQDPTRRISAFAQLMVRDSVDFVDAAKELAFTLYNHLDLESASAFAVRIRESLEAEVRAKELPVTSEQVGEIVDALFVLALDVIDGFPEREGRA
jgi:hypothetical protein